MVQTLISQIFTGKKMEDISPSVCIDWFLANFSPNSTSLGGS